jgi:hypothetical protein
MLRREHLCIKLSTALLLVKIDTDPLKTSEVLLRRIVAVQECDATEAS